MDAEELTGIAGEASQKAIAPYSGFKVGAALLTDSGRCYTGCNIENPTLMLTMCAERVALFKALSEGERSFSSISIVSSEGEYCFPCGACRQLLVEFAPGIKVIVKSKEGLKTFTIENLLPYHFKR